MALPFLRTAAIAAVYPVVLLEVAIFFSTLIAFCELFALQPCQVFAQEVHDAHQALDQALASPHAPGQTTPGPGTPSHEAYQVSGGVDGDETAEPTETTPLRIGELSRGEDMRTLFAATYRRSIAAILEAPDPGANHEPFGYEQKWSDKLPSWTWCLQLLIMVPLPVIIFGQIGLFLVTAASGTGAEGSNLTTPYAIAATMSLFILLPLTPFLHRVSRLIPLVLVALFVCLFVYSLVTFPFSPTSPYKFYFKQTWDLDSGNTNVSVVGLEQYVRTILDEIPAAMGQKIECMDVPSRAPLRNCYYNASKVLPNVADSTSNSIQAEKALIDISVSRPDLSAGKATIRLDAANTTRMCQLEFDRPISNFAVRGGAGLDDRFGRTPRGGVDYITLYRRDRSRAWTLDVEWDAGVSGLGGVAVCMWDDVNMPSTVPAFEEMRRYAPAWSIVTKQSPGLVEGFKRFQV